MKLYKIESYLGAFLYIILGFLTIGSILNGTIGWWINLIMGMLFIAIGYYLYSKVKSIIN
jgi:riboflavin transporter FmnP